MRVESQKAEFYVCSKVNFLAKFPKDAHEELRALVAIRGKVYDRLYQEQKKFVQGTVAASRQRVSPLLASAHY